MVGEASPGYSLRSKRAVQLVAGLGSSVAPFLVASMFVAAPAIGEDLGGEVALLPWLTAAFFLTAASLLIPFGRIADVRGSKKVFTAGMVAYIVSGAMCALAPDLLILIMGRALTGAGAAMVFGTSIALLSLVFPERERGKAIGLNVTSMFAGFTAGLLAGGFVTYYLSWRLLFLIAAVIAGANLVLLRSKVKGECELAREKSFDLVGMVLFTATLLLVFFGLSEVATSLGQGCVVAGAVVAVVLLVWERRSPHPMIHSGISRNRLFILSVITSIIFQAGSFAIPFLLSLYAQLSLHLDPREASFILLVPQVLMTIMSSVSGRALVRTGSHTITSLGVIINALGISILLVLGDASILGMVVSLALLGVGTGMFMPALINWAMSSILRQEYGVASAITETSRLMGMTLSNVILILVLSFLSIDGASGDGLARAVQAASLVFLATTLLALPPSLLGGWILGGRQPRPPRGQ